MELHLKWCFILVFFVFLFLWINALNFFLFWKSAEILILVESLWHFAAVLVYLFNLSFAIRSTIKRIMLKPLFSLEATLSLFDHLDELCKQLKMALKVCSFKVTTYSTLRWKMYLTDVLKLSFSELNLGPHLSLLST